MTFKRTSVEYISTVTLIPDSVYQRIQHVWQKNDWYFADRFRKGRSGA